MKLASRLYTGHVRHRRFSPHRHEFRQRLFLMYLDLDELPGLLRQHWLWSSTRPNLAWFRRADHLGDPNIPLSDAVRSLIEARTGVRPRGPIRLLTHLRYAGFAMNPISLYYCFDEQDSLQFVVAEVSNTPWNEQHCYVLDIRGERGTSVDAVVAKEFHVSPFLGMNYRYRFALTKPGRLLIVHIENMPLSSGNVPHRESLTAPVFDATLTLHEQPINSRSLAWALIRYPLMTAQVYAGIYWQALRLWLKRTPYFPHPRGLTETSEDLPLQAVDRPVLPASQGSQHHTHSGCRT